MSRRPIEGGFDTGATPEDDAGGGEGVSAQAFKDAMAEWASTVTLIAARDGNRVLATTATSFAPVAADPPTIVVSLGASAQVLPAMTTAGEPFVVSFLARNQRRIASIHADSFPVGPSPFPADGPPVVEGALLALLCEVVSVHPVDGNARLVTGRVVEVREGQAGQPLIYWRREYHGLEGDG